ncbi:MAG: rod shape-determining protein MreC [Cystobacterineae bacterium]|nr:rod shape-determining protein MreC [Cystobacterineae bacterium]
MRPLLKHNKQKLLVVFLLVGPLLAFLTTGHKGRLPNEVDKCLLSAAVPIQKGFEWIGAGVFRTVEEHWALRQAREEKTQCTVELGEMKSKMYLLEETQLENQRLREFLAYTRTTPSTEIVGRVIGINPSPHFLSFRMDRGEKDGVRVDMPVVTPAGIVGRVVRTIAHASDAMLVSDPRSHVAAVVQRSRVRATVVGTGGGKLLSVTNVLRADDLVEGDVVVTSGTDGIFPPGLMVGTIQNVQRGTGMFLNADVELSADLKRLEEVLLLPEAAVAYGFGKEVLK